MVRRSFRKARNTDIIKLISTYIEMQVKLKSDFITKFFLLQSD